MRARKQCIGTLRRPLNPNLDLDGTIPGQCPGGAQRSFELTMEKVPMTAEGYAALEAEIKHLKTVERPRIIKAIADARTHGDLAENAEYHAAKEQQGITEARMADLEDKLSRADIIDVSKLKGDQVMFGATVTLLDEDTDDKVKYRVVGELEADVKKGKISITSPLARALLGKRKNNIVEVSTPGGGKSYKVLKVEFK